MLSYYCTYILLLRQAERLYILSFPITITLQAKYNRHIAYYGIVVLFVNYTKRRKTVYTHLKLHAGDPLHW